MKKLILVVAAALVSTGAFAQDNSRGMEWGVKAGLNLAKMSKVSDSKMRAGFYLGAFGEYGFGETFGVQAELLYSQMGVKTGKGDNTTTIKADYLSLPILAKLYLVHGLSLDLGPQFSYLISAKSRQEVGGHKTTYNWYKDEDTNKFDIGFAMGLSYRITTQFDVSARYNLGLTETVKDSKMKNNVFALGVGYRF